MQPLVFEPLRAARHLEDRRHRQRIVGGELRVDPRPRIEQLPRAGEIRLVGRRLAREDRIVGKPPLLPALDLGVPVRPLHQPDHELAAEPFGEIVDPPDHRRSPFLVGLDRQPEPFPSRKRRIGSDFRDHPKRNFKPVRFLRVDGEVEVMRLRCPREFDQPRHQLGHHPLVLHRLVAWMERG